MRMDKSIFHLLFLPSLFYWFNNIILVIYTEYLGLITNFSFPQVQKSLMYYLFRPIYLTEVWFSVLKLNHVEYTENKSSLYCSFIHIQ